LIFKDVFLVVMVIENVGILMIFVLLSFKTIV